MTRRRGRSPTAEDRRRIVTLYQTCLWSGPRISEEVGLSKTTVIRVVKEAGVQVRRERGRDAKDRFMEWVSPEPNTGCWLWLGQAHWKNGYAYMGRGIQAYRWAYENFIGPVPEGLEIDHKCRNILCVNPNHMEPVTRRENLLRAPNSIINRVLRGDHPTKGKGKKKAA